MPPDGHLKFVPTKGFMGTNSNEVMVSKRRGPYRHHPPALHSNESRPCMRSRARFADPPDVRRKEREQAKPILEEFHAWLLDTRRQLSKKSGLAEAIGYALNHWQALIRYASDGRIEIDNNAANGPCGRWHSAARIICLPPRMLVVIALPRFTA